MPLSELTSRAAVLRALREFDKVGRVAFLERYGFGAARSYVLRHDGREYDSKAIAGAAYGYQYPKSGSLAASDFSGGANTVARVLGALGFDVRATTVDAPLGQVQRWALCARPSRYRVRDAVAHVDVDHWLSKGKPIKAGDTAVIWQTRDRDGQRGVVALGDVIGGPVARRNTGNPYWVDAADGDQEEERVPIRYRQIPRPLWIDDTAAGRFLSTLSVARARGGTVFRLTEEQWLELVGMTGATSGLAEVAELEEAVRRRAALARGQGFGLSLDERVAVEKRAMQRAEDYFKAHWPEVLDVFGTVQLRPPVPVGRWGVACRGQGHDVSGRRDRPHAARGRRGRPAWLHVVRLLGNRTPSR